MVIAVFVLDTVCIILLNVKAFLLGRHSAFSFAILRDFPSLFLCFLRIAWKALWTLTCESQTLAMTITFQTKSS